MAFLTCEEEASRFPENFSHLEKAGKAKQGRSPVHEGGAPLYTQGNWGAGIPSRFYGEKLYSVCLDRVASSTDSSYIKGFLGLGCVYIPV